jgi:ribonuclease HI
MSSLPLQEKLFTRALWVDGGCNSQTKPDAWGSVVDDNGMDVLCREEVSCMIDDLKSRIESVPNGKVSIGGFRKVLISSFTDVSYQQNNGAELLAMVAALRIAKKYPEIKEIRCDSQLLVNWWSKGHVSLATKKKMDNSKLLLIVECGNLRKVFEENGGVITKIKGSDNKADLGFHKN